MLQCVGVMVESCEVSSSQAQSADDALLCLQLPHPKDIIPRRGLITSAKVVKYFELCKKKSLFGAFFLVQGVK